MCGAIVASPNNRVGYFYIALKAKLAQPIYATTGGAFKFCFSKCRVCSGCAVVCTEVGGGAVDGGLNSAQL